MTMRLQECSTLSDDLTDKEIINLIVIEIVALEAQGVLMPKDWRHHATNLKYLNSLLLSSIEQLKALIQRAKKSR